MVGQALGGEAVASQKHTGVATGKGYTGFITSQAANECGAECISFHVTADADELRAMLNRDRAESST